MRRRRFLSFFIASSPLPLAIAPSAGCRLEGTWHAVRFSPKAVDAAVVDVATFTPDGRFTITERQGAERNTTTGRYTWDGFSLKLRSERDAHRTLRCRQPSTSELVIASGPTGARWSATFHPDE